MKFNNELELLFGTCKDLLHQIHKKNYKGISLTEFMALVSNILPTDIKAQLISIFHEYANDGLLNYDAFIKCVIQRDIFFMEITEFELIQAFEVFDIDNDGFISMDDYKITMSKLGEELTHDIIEETFREIGLCDIDKIDYILFKKLIIG